MSTDQIEKAVAYFDKGYNCCQSILLAYGPDLRLSTDLAVHLGTGFGGGMARQGECCGAVTGAIMVIGLKFGMANETDDVARGKTYEFVSELMNKFKAQKGSVKCRDLLDCDISTPEGRAVAQEKDLFKTLCPDLVRTSAEILESLQF